MKSQGKQRLLLLYCSTHLCNNLINTIQFLLVRHIPWDSEHRLEDQMLPRGQCPDE